MTDPRCIQPGESCLVTRRCSERRFFLKPSALVNQIFLYVLGYTAQKYGIALHAFAVMSNHYHLVLTDVLGRLPDFVRDLDNFLTQAINRFYRRRGTIWSSDKPHYLLLEEIEDVVAKAVYTLANPVAAGLVPSHSQWPGAISRLEHLDGAVIRVKKPPFFFGKSFPETVEIRLLPPLPSKLQGESAEEFRAEIRQRLEEEQREIRHKRAAHGKGFLNKRKIEKQSHNDSPIGEDHRSGSRPRIAAQDTATRLEAIARYREFVRAYRAALEKYRGGDHQVLFPRGTWKLRVELNVRCEPFESS